MVAARCLSSPPPHLSVSLPPPIQSVSAVFQSPNPLNPQTPSSPHLSAAESEVEIFLKENKRYQREEKIWSTRLYKFPDPAFAQPREKVLQRARADFWGGRHSFCSVPEKRPGPKRSQRHLSANYKGISSRRVFSLPLCLSHTGIGCPHRFSYKLCIKLMKTLTFAKNSAFLGRLPFEGRRRAKGAAEVGVGVGVGGGEVKEGMMCKVGRVLSHILSGKKKFYSFQ